MKSINTKIDLNIKKVTEKWKPIIDNIFGDPNYDDNNIIEICKYCEYDSINRINRSKQNLIDNVRYDNMVNIDDLMDMNKLSVSIKMLSKLNMDGKILLSTPSPIFDYIDMDEVGPTLVNGNRIDTHFYFIDIPEGFEELSESNIEGYLTHSIIEKLCSKINQQLKYYDTLVIYSMLDNIRKSHNKISFQVRYRLLDRNDKKEPLFEVKKNEHGYIENIEILKIDMSEFIELKDSDNNSYWLNKSDNTISNDILTEDKLTKLLSEYENKLIGIKGSIEHITKYLS